MENPYESPKRPNNGAQAPKLNCIVTWYRVLSVIGFVALIGVSVFLSYWRSDTSPIRLDQIYLIVGAELFGVLLALAAVLAFLVRAGFLLTVGRFQDAAIDALFAGAAFVVSFTALVINP